jgi:hypothetical protein
MSTSRCFLLPIPDSPKSYKMDDCFIIDIGIHLEFSEIVLILFSVVIGSFIGGLFSMIPKEHRYAFAKRFLEFLVPFSLSAFLFLWGENSIKSFISNLSDQIWILSMALPIFLLVVALAIFALLIYETMDVLSKIKKFQTLERKRVKRKRGGRVKENE